jgi:hypothetical protein
MSFVFNFFSVFRIDSRLLYKIIILSFQFLYRLGVLFGCLLSFSWLIASLELFEESLIIKLLQVILFDVIAVGPRAVSVPVDARVD